MKKLDELEKSIQKSWLCGTCGGIAGSEVRIDTILHLIASLKKAREALEFYSDETSWRRPIAGNSAVIIDISDCHTQEETQWMRGGKRARQILAELEKEWEK